MGYSKLFALPRHRGKGARVLPFLRKPPRPSGANQQGPPRSYASQWGRCRLPRAQAKLTLANLAYNFDLLIFHERCAATG